LADDLAGLGVLELFVEASGAPGRSLQLAARFGAYRVVAEVAQAILLVASD
jgi:hypothetical protein